MSDIIENSSIVKVVLVVQDVEKKAALFGKLFGLDEPKVVISQPAPTDEASSTFTMYNGNRITGRVKLVNLSMGPIILELVEPVDHESPWGEHLRRHGEGIFSIVYTVDHFESQREVLERAGFPLFHLGEYGAGRYAYFDTLKALGITLCLQNLERRAPQGGSARVS